MGKETGFLEWPRKGAPKRPTERRIQDWREVYLPRNADEIKRQGGRCMDCGVPFCEQGCPLGNLIPDWNDLVYRDQWEAAFRSLSSTNNFPEFTGRLCPAPCEAACVLSINDQAVTIEQIEKEIIERAFEEGWVVARPPAVRTGKRVAVVGSGPAGLAAASQLNQAGHEVVVFDKADKPGGLLRYGIPDFKMEKSVVDRRLDLLRAEGIRFECGVNVGVDLSWTELRRGYDAVLIAIGAEKPKPFAVPGADLPGVYDAMEYLIESNKRTAGYPEPADPMMLTGQRVVILGGGDTGSDCLGTAHRQGAREIATLQKWPAPPGQRPADNPWPQWPHVFMTSTSQEEGGAREFALLTKRLSGNGRVEKLHAVRIEVTTDAAGRQQAVEVPGSELEMDVDAVVLAIGFAGPFAERLREELGVTLDARGNIAVDAAYRTNVDGLYCAGDAMRGASIIVWAIMDGREAARSIDRALRGSGAWLPSRGRNEPFEDARRSKWG